MPKYYCDYCDSYLTHDSPSVRKTHFIGRKHRENVRDYYQKWMEEQTQSLIDKTTAAFKTGKIAPKLPPGFMPPGMPPMPMMMPGMPGMPPIMPPLPPGMMPPPMPPGMMMPPPGMMGFMRPPGMPPGMPPMLPPGMPSLPMPPNVGAPPPPAINSASEPIEQSTKEEE